MSEGRTGRPWPRVNLSALAFVHGALPRRLAGCEPRGRRRSHRTPSLTREPATVLEQSVTTTEHPGLTIITETLVTMTTSAIAGAETYARRVGTKGAWEAVVALKAALYDLSVATSWYHYDVLRESR